MPVGPRVVFVRFTTSASPKLTPWITHAERVVGSTPSTSIAETTIGDAVVWQLVSANNRQLARGAAVHPTFQEAHAHASAVVGSSDRLRLVLASEPGRGVYGWHATLDDQPAMTCSRWYLTERDRRYSIEVALRSIAVAVLHTGSRLADPALMAGEHANG